MRRATHCASSASPGCTEITSTDTGRGSSNVRPATRVAASIPARPFRTVSTALRISARLRKFSTSSTRCRPLRCTSSRYCCEPLRLGVAEAEDRLVDVADGIEAVRRANQFEQFGLLPVGVLELVHQDLVELAPAGARACPRAPPAAAR